MGTSTTIPTPEVTAAPSTEPPAAPTRTPTVGDIVLVTVDPLIQRPLIVSRVQQHVQERTTNGVKTLLSTPRVSGTLFCEPDDYARNLLRGAFDRQGDPARVEGRPSRVNPVAYGYMLGPGAGIGQWEFKP